MLYDIDRTTSLKSIFTIEASFFTEYVRNILLRQNELSCS